MPRPCDVTCPIRHRLRICGYRRADDVLWTSPPHRPPSSRVPKPGGGSPAVSGGQRNSDRLVQCLSGCAPVKGHSWSGVEEVLHLGDVGVVGDPRSDWEPHRGPEVGAGSAVAPSRCRTCGGADVQGGLMGVPSLVVGPQLVGGLGTCTRIGSHARSTSWLP